MDENATTLLLITSITVLVLVVVIVIIFSIFQNRKIKYVFRQKEQEQLFKQEITRAQLEAREQTLQNISWELHDNIGQLLSVAIMQLNMVLPSVKDNELNILSETSEILTTSLQEIRGISKLLNTEYIKRIGLCEAVENEINRLNKLNKIVADLKITGKCKDIDDTHEIILFRIIQEFLSNSIKHSKSNQLHADINFGQRFLEINAMDNGIGFDKDTNTKGNGLLNMETRAKLIGADYKLQSGKNEGVKLSIKYPLN
ncbi:MAG: histidine kinase [Flavobacteriales bacterium]|nr:MAG: histidine kinase [Flavobacteriales bacterium]PIE49725.1 MAG: histidine kinase [Flavobacteriales bacterium]